MLDLSSLSNWAEILSGGGSAVVALWKFIIKPRRNKIEAQAKRIKDLEDRIKKLEETSRQNDNSSILQQDHFQIEELKKDYEKLSKSIDDHISKIDAKNDKLLDLIIKYFTEKE